MCYILVGVHLEFTSLGVSDPDTHTIHTCSSVLHAPSPPHPKGFLIVSIEHVSSEHGGEVKSLWTQWDHLTTSVEQQMIRLWLMIFCCVTCFIWPFESKTATTWKQLVDAEVISSYGFHCSPHRFACMRKWLLPSHIGQSICQSIGCTCAHVRQCDVTWAVVNLPLSGKKTYWLKITQ